MRSVRATTMAHWEGRRAKRKAWKYRCTEKARRPMTTAVTPAWNALLPMGTQESHPDSSMNRLA